MKRLKKWINKKLCEIFGHKKSTSLKFYINKQTGRWSQDFFSTRCLRDGCEFEFIEFIEPAEKPGKE